MPYRYFLIAAAAVSLPPVACVSVALDAEDVRAYTQHQGRCERFTRLSRSDITVEVA